MVRPRSQNPAPEIAAASDPVAAGVAAAFERAVRDAAGRHRVDGLNDTEAVAAVALAAQPAAAEAVARAAGELLREAPRTMASRERIAAAAGVSISGVRAAERK